MERKTLFLSERFKVLKKQIYLKFNARALPYQMSEQTTKLEQLK